MCIRDSYVELLQLSAGPDPQGSRTMAFKPCLGSRGGEAEEQRGSASPPPPPHQAVFQSRHLCKLNPVAKGSVNLKTTGTLLLRNIQAWEDLKTPDFQGGEALCIL